MNTVLICCTTKFIKIFLQSITTFYYRCVFTIISGNEKWHTSIEDWTNVLCTRIPGNICSNLSDSDLIFREARTETKERACDREGWPRPGPAYLRYPFSCHANPLGEVEVDQYVYIQCHVRALHRCKGRGFKDHSWPDPLSLSSASFPRALVLFSEAIGSALTLYLAGGIAMGLPSFITKKKEKT